MGQPISKRVVRRHGESVADARTRGLRSGASFVTVVAPPAKRNLNELGDGSTESVSQKEM